MQIIVATPNLDEAVRLAAAGFVQSITDELVADVANHLSGDLVVYMVEDEMVIGFATFSVHGELLYLNGIQLNPVVHGRSVCGEVIAFARDETETSYLALRTQNPRMWAAGRKLCTVWLPSDNDDAIDAELSAMIALLETERSLPFPVHVGCYGTPLYGEKPIHRDESVQRWWDAICNFEAGDGIVCVGRFQ